MATAFAVPTTRVWNCAKSATALFTLLAKAAAARAACTARASPGVPAAALAASAARA